MDEVTQSYTPSGDAGGPDDGGGGPGRGDGRGDDDGGADRRKVWWILGGVLVAGLIVGIVIALLTNNDSGSKKTAATTPSSTTTSSTSTTSTTIRSTTTSGGTATTAQPTTPVINSFTVPGTVSCHPKKGTTINVSWSTSNTTSVTLSIDGPGIYKSYPGSSGSDSVPFACSVASHTYLLTAKGPAGDTTKTITATRGP